MKDSFELYKEIYRIDKTTYDANVRLFTELLDMGDFLKTPIRQLSLGQRMKAEISLALLHNPKTLYLDEPTIGLDVLAKNNIRQFILKSNQERGTTIILTSHDMKDLDQVCRRIVMISKGRLIFDGKTEDFKRIYGGGTMIHVTFAKETQLSHPLLSVTDIDNTAKTILFDKKMISLPEVITYLTTNFETLDVTVKEPDIEEIVRDIYSKSLNR